MSSNHDEDASLLYQHPFANRKPKGTLPVSRIGFHVHPEDDAIEQVAQMLGHPASFVDQDGYEVVITSAAIHPEKSWPAWVVRRVKELDTNPNTGVPMRYVDISYRLRAMIDGKIVIDWDVYSYNPYFGCIVGYLGWHENQVVMIYREKHETFIAAAQADGPVKYMQVEDKWSLQASTVASLGWRGTEIKRLSIPHLEPQESISKEAAIAAGILAPDDN